MDIRSNIRKDLALRNATVYGQWLCVLGAISCVLMRISWAIEFGLSEKTATAIRLVDAIFFPLCALSVELHAFRWRRMLGISFLWCLGRTALDLKTTWDEDGAEFLRTGVMPPSWRSIARGLAELAMFFWLLFPLSKREGVYSVRIRALFHTAFTAAFIFGARGLPFVPPDSKLWPAALRFEPAEVFSGLASLMYWVALCTGQDYVFSRTLGGPGVEMMTLLMDGQAPEYDFLGQAEGRIMLS
ncbi:hypothetical protein F4677DRAFT_406750 [Hypoxylon crocopeplum]|nr:hypothetical protein F4677DRAFT_406750 [Hypoxylon crocopeplum]